VLIAWLKSKKQNSMNEMEDTKQYLKGCYCRLLEDLRNNLRSVNYFRGKELFYENIQLKIGENDIFKLLVQFGDERPVETKTDHGPPTNERLQTWV
jgi:hypothetical protein